MRWDDVIRVTSAAAAANPILSGIFGEAIRAAGSAEFEHPALEYTLISDTEEFEIWAPCVIQWDAFTPSMDSLIAAARALNGLFNHDIPVAILGTYMFAEYIDGAVLASPDVHGFYGRGFRYRFTPIREQYMRPT